MNHFNPSIAAALYQFQAAQHQQRPQQFAYQLNQHPRVILSSVRGPDQPMIIQDQKNSAQIQTSRGHIQSAHHRSEFLFREQQIKIEVEIDTVNNTKTTLIGNTTAHGLFTDTQNSSINQPTHLQLAMMKDGNLFDRCHSVPNKEQLDDFQALINKRLDGKEAGRYPQENNGLFQQEARPHQIIPPQHLRIPGDGNMGVPNTMRPGFIKFNSESSTPSSDQKIQYFKQHPNMIMFSNEDNSHEPNLGHSHQFQHLNTGATQIGFAASSFIPNNPRNLAANFPFGHTVFNQHQSLVSGQSTANQMVCFDRNSEKYLLSRQQEEAWFSPSQQRKRRRLAQFLDSRQSQDIIIKSFNKKPKCSTLQSHVDSEAFRGSRYRGISKNGRNSWQVLVMVNRNKKYVGAIYDELKAARIYDQIAIQYQGIAAKTNFAYTKAEIIDILKMKPVLMGGGEDSQHQDHLSVPQSLALHIE
ncbi:hypothetical protein FGO68_gene5971 [Halteria grandinella]|uniref:AP2/ERF domain-containing protein n=1 Tax=Halteria grandinella TaxID=5974 RepID=A0A8J8NSQ7_HALGN|nr:hypothetical protein FGO68_gene5971 [Halteria grandinella]